MNTKAFDTWLLPTTQRSIDGARLVVEVPSAHFADWISRTYRDDIEQAMHQIGARGIVVEFAATDTSRPRLPAPVSALETAEPTTPAKPYTTFRVSSGLLDPKHVTAIGGALWLFLWCIDKQTGPHGLILGGCPITLAQIARQLPFTERHLARQLARLEMKGYLTAKRFDRGLVMHVEMQKKFGPRRQGVTVSKGLGHFGPTPT
jgi:hypothetical protein